MYDLAAVEMAGLARKPLDDRGNREMEGHRVCFHMVEVASLAGQNEELHHGSVDHQNWPMVVVRDEREGFVGNMIQTSDHATLEFGVFDCMPIRE